MVDDGWQCDHGHRVWSEMIISNPNRSLSLTSLRYASLRSDTMNEWMNRSERSVPHIHDLIGFGDDFTAAGNKWTDRSNHQPSPVKWWGDVVLSLPRVTRPIRGMPPTMVVLFLIRMPTFLREFWTKCLVHCRDVARQDNSCSIPRTFPHSHILLVFITDRFIKGLLALLSVDQPKDLDLLVSIGLALCYTLPTATHCWNHEPTGMARLWWRPLVKLRSMVHIPWGSLRLMVDLQCLTMVLYG